VEELRRPIGSPGLDKLDHRSGRGPEGGLRGLDRLDHRTGRDQWVGLRGLDRLDPRTGRYWQGVLRGLGELDQRTTEGAVPILVDRDDALRGCWSYCSRSRACTRRLRSTPARFSTTRRRKAAGSGLASNQARVASTRAWFDNGDG